MNYFFFVLFYSPKFNVALLDQNLMVIHFKANSNFKNHTNFKKIIRRPKNSS
jgi:hypothetical protein